MTEEADPSTELEVEVEEAGRGRRVRPHRLAAERDEYLDALRRVQAEFDNYRKRARQAAGRDAPSGPPRPWSPSCCPVLDACDAAVQHGAADVGPDRQDAARDPREGGPGEARPPRASPSTPTSTRRCSTSRATGRAAWSPRSCAPVPRGRAASCARPWCKVRGLSRVDAQREWFEKDYYKILGVSETATPEGDHQGLPQAGPRAPPRRQPGRRRGRGALQGGLRRLRRGRRRRQAQGVRRGPRLGAGRRLRRRRPVARAASAGGFGGGAERRRPRRPARRPLRPRPGSAAQGRSGRARSGAPTSRPSCTSPSTTPLAGVTTSVQPGERRGLLDLPRHRGQARQRRPVACPQCGGRGVLDDNQGFFSFSPPCPRCAGRGMVVTDPCPTCSRLGHRAPAPRGQGPHPRRGQRRPAHPAQGPRRSGSQRRPARRPLRGRPRRPPPAVRPQRPQPHAHRAGHLRRGGARHQRHGPHPRRRAGHPQDPGRAPARADVPGEGHGVR